MPGEDVVWVPEIVCVWGGGGQGMCYCHLSVLDMKHHMVYCPCALGWCTWLLYTQYHYHQSACLIHTSPSPIHTQPHAHPTLHTGVRVCRVVQAPGEFVITFPRAYHANFHTGFALSESVSVATLEWLPFGVESSVRLRQLQRSSGLPLEELLCMQAQQLKGGWGRGWGKRFCCVVYCTKQYM